MLRLNNTTLVLVETREHALAKLALEECLSKVEFEDVLILTDKPGLFESSQLAYGHKIRFHQIPDYPTKLGWSRAWWREVTPLLRTAHTLNIQWDSWVWDTSQWSDDFYNYDYVGSCWWYRDGKNVGNGGFSWVSTALKRYLRDRQDKFPCDTAVDDDLLCRKYRPALEEAGFVWAPESVASRFAFECVRPAPDSRHFGFHGAFNFNEVLTHDRLVERAELMLQSPTISKTGYMMEAFCKKNPDLVRELLQGKAAAKGA